MNRGAEALKEALSERGSAVELARKLDVDPSVVSRWVSGQVKPVSKFRAEIEDEFGIGWRLWDEPVEGGAGHAA